MTLESPGAATTTTYGRGAGALQPSALVLLLMANEILLFVGLVLYPTVLNEGGLLGLGAATVILLIYGYLALYSPFSYRRAGPRAVRPGIVLGLVGGLILCVDLVFSYFVRRDATASATSSLLAYGCFLLLVLVSGVTGAYRTGRFRGGITTALWCVLCGLLLWFFVEFTSFYLFAGTTAGAEFVRQEMKTDFERSGSTDFWGFTMSDFYGAGFYHLLLGLVIVGILGSVGALVGLFARSILRRS